MIHVEISMWPGGDPTKAYNLGMINIANDNTSDTPNVGNYYSNISKSKQPKTMWKQVEVKGFPRRSLNVYHLLYRVLKQAIEPSEEGT